MIKISKEEFEKRIESIQSKMDKKGIDGMMVYGNEYRKENLRYLSNFWLIFERGACFIPKSGKAILAGAPEGETYAREMTVLDDVRNIKEFACVSVPEEIEYPNSNFALLKDIMAETLGGGKKLGVVGYWDIPGPIMDRVKSSINGTEIIDSADIINDLRIIKTPAEIACLREAGRQACIGYEQLLKTCVPGNTELMAAGAAEGAARAAGAEDINFMVFGSGKRADTVIEDGDMVMAAMAVQYEGYVSTVEFPFVFWFCHNKRWITYLW